MRSVAPYDPETTHEGDEFSIWGMKIKEEENKTKQNKTKQVFGDILFKAEMRWKKREFNHAEDKSNITMI
jgi:hypothetical protein